MNFPCNLTWIDRFRPILICPHGFTITIDEYWVISIDILVANHNLYLEIKNESLQRTL